MSRTLPTRLHPGQVLFDEFMEPLGLNQSRVAAAIGVPPIRISELVRAKRAMTADTALRLSRYFGNSAQFWMNLQTLFDLDTAESSGMKELNKIEAFASS